MNPIWRGRSAYLLLLLFALFLRLPHFTPLALIGSDGSEYVYCVEEGYFPHSPYILHMAAGFVIDLFVSLDWGYSALSMAASLLSILLLGGVVHALTGSFWAGWFAALIHAVTPVSIRFAGFQEVYAYQLFWIVLGWFLLLRKKSHLWGGVAIGAAFATHTGTVFALPTTLLLLLFSLEGRGLSKPTFAALGRFAAGIVIPVAAAFGWLGWIWITKSGQPLSLLPVYIRGAAPSPNLGLLFGPDGVDYLEEQILRTWRDLSDIEVIGPALLIGGFLSFLLVGLRRSLPWLLLSLPYLAYEIAMGYALDPGIFLVFVAPTVAVGMGCLAASFIRGTQEGWGLLPLIPLLAVLLGGGFTLAQFQRTAEVRNLLPWLQNESSTMALSRFVRDHSPEDTLLIQPVDWDPTGLASTLYSRRTPLFNDGEILLLEPWKPLFTHPIFNHVRSVKTEDFDRWLDEERPILCFDPDPFRAWGCYWPFVDIDRFETRPLLWLDRNQSGTSLHTENGFPLVEFEVGDASAAASFDLRIPDSAARAEVVLPMFRPTLYRIARKTDPPDHPAWASDLQSLVPENQREPVPEIRLSGVGFDAAAGVVEVELPAVPEKDLAIGLTLNSHGAEYIVECRVEVGGRWKAVGRDMEKIVVGETMQFADLYFKIPGNLISDSSVRVRFLPVLGTERLNAYRLTASAIRQK